jgi:serine/threonine protein phosphatase PrpC
LKFNSKPQALFGVFDGHGGREVAYYTEKHYRDILKETEGYRCGDLPNALRQSFLKVDEELEKEGGKEELAAMKRKNPPNKAPLFKLLGDINGTGAGAAGGDQSTESLQLDSIGCTANVILIEDMKKIITANAGDSRSVLGRGGKALALSFDHKPDDEIELTRIEKAGSVVTEGRVDGNLNLSRSLGDLKYKVNKELKPEEWPITANPDLKVVDIEPEDDFIIMGCDGIWETKTNEEMVEYIYDRLK